MSLFIFTGPTLPADEGRRHLDAHFLPPAAQGDVYRAAREKPVAIGIIDGYFDRVPSVSHKEILWAMAQGVHVLGAASMGALRPAELSLFGMEGVGAVYESYASTALVADDEVAVAHAVAEDGYRPLSEALVNIRATLRAAGAGEAGGDGAGDVLSRSLLSAPPPARRGGGDGPGRARRARGVPARGARRSEAPRRAGAAPGPARALRGRRRAPEGGAVSLRAHRRLGAHPRAGRPPRRREGGGIMSAAIKEAPSRLGELILVWLASHGGGATPSDLANVPRALRPQASDDDCKRAVLDELVTLDKSGYLARRNKAARVLTESGKRAVLSALGVTALPGKGDWTAHKNAYLAKYPDPHRNPATALARQFNLGFLGATPKLVQVRDALAWKALGIETTEPFNITRVRAALSKQVDVTAAAPVPVPPGTVQVSAMGSQGAQLTLPTSSPVVKKAELPADDAAFAKRVLSAARASKTGRFGGNKVFISHVLRQLGADGFAIDGDAVKARLVSAHQAGLLVLTRADMVEAMPTDDVKASELSHRNATFHFVRT